LVIEVSKSIGPEKFKMVAKPEIGLFPGLNNFPRNFPVIEIPVFPGIFPVKKVYCTQFLAIFQNQLVSHRPHKSNRS